MSETLAAIVILAGVSLALIFYAGPISQGTRRMEDQVFRAGRTGPGNVSGPLFIRSAGLFMLALLLVLLIISWQQGEL